MSRASISKYIPQCCVACNYFSTSYILTCVTQVLNRQEPIQNPSPPIWICLSNPGTFNHSPLLTPSKYFLCTQAMLSCLMLSAQHTVICQADRDGMHLGAMVLMWGSGLYIPSALHHITIYQCNIQCAGKPIVKKHCSVCKQICDVNCCFTLK